MILTAATWNVNSVRARLPHVTRWLSDNPVEILCLQETKVTDEAFPREPFQEMGYHSTVHGQKSYNGVAVLSRVPLSEVSRGLPSGFLGEQARLLEFSCKGVRFLNAYVPNGGSVELPAFQDKLRWLKELQEEAAHPGQPVIVMGDFNVAPEPIDTHSPEEQDGTVCFHPLERERIRSFLDAGFTDVFRFVNPGERSYTWWDYRAGAFRRNLGMRLDLVLASGAGMDLVRHVRIDPSPRGWERPSDHVPVEFGLDVRE